MSLFGCCGEPKPARMGTGVTNSRGKLSAAFSFPNRSEQLGKSTYIVIVLWGFLFLETSFRVIFRWIISNNNNIILNIPPPPNRLSKLE